MRILIASLLFALNAAALASAEPNTISTYAGGGPVNGPALSINVSPQGIAATANGDVYFSSSDAVYKLSGSIAILIAGTPGVQGYSGDEGPAIDAVLNYPHGVAVDKSGNVYIADSGNYRIRKVSAGTGEITTVAGNGSAGFLGDDGPATAASLDYVTAIAADGGGNVFLAESTRIRKVSAGTGVITTVAGNGSNSGSSGDGGPAPAAGLIGANGVAVDGSGNLYISENGSHSIRKVSADTGVITAVAGNGSDSLSGDIGDGGPATAASLSNFNGLAVDDLGSLYIADSGHNRIRKVSAATGVITTVAGNGLPTYGGTTDIGDGGPATEASVSFVTGVAVDGSGNFYIADAINYRIRKVGAETGVITTVAGNGSRGFSGDGGPATGASLSDATTVALDGSGNLYIVDRGNNRVRKVSAKTGMITTAVGNGTIGFDGDGGPATDASLTSISGLAADSNGDLYVADGGNNRIRKVSAITRVITTFAGNGSYSNTANIGDGGPAVDANLASVGALAVDANGNLYMVSNNRIRKVSADTGVITTVAGNESSGYSGDGGPATSASLSYPPGIAVDGAGNIYIVDQQRIRKVSADTGVITTVAGNDRYGFSGDGGPATSASLNYPHGVGVDGKGNLYIADSNSQRIREVFAATGTIATVAGDGGYGFRGDNGPATNARLAYPFGVAVETDGKLYIVAGNQRIRKVEGRLPTTTLVTSNANPTTTQNLVLSAAISSGDATGSVQFFDGFTALGNVELSAGTATLSDLWLTVGTHSLVGVYSGDTNHAMSTSAPLLQVVSRGRVGTFTLTSDARATESYGRTIYVSTPNSPVTFTATLTPAEASGTVEFVDGSTSLGVQTVSGGTAVFTTSSLPAGIHKIAGVYSGDASFRPRRAKAITLRVRDTAPESN